MKQITVVTADRTGLVADLTARLMERGLNVLSIQARSVGGDAVVQIDVDDRDAALAALTAAGYPAMSEEVLAVRVEDRPGALAQIARQLADAGVDLRGISLVQRGGGRCIVAITVHDHAAARRVLGPLLLQDAP